MNCRQITSVEEFDKSKSQKFIFRADNRDKVLSKGFLVSWQYKTLCDNIMAGRIWEMLDEERQHYIYGNSPTQGQLLEAVEVLKAERLGWWLPKLPGEQQLEIEDAHNVAMWVIKKELKENERTDTE